MSLSSNPETRRKNPLPLWVKVISFVLAVGFLLLMVLVLNRTNLHTLKLGDTVPDFTLTTFDGQQIQLSSLRGKPVVLNFWASWCSECQQEAQMLENTWQSIQPGGAIMFLGVDYADTEKAAQAFIKTNGISYLNGPDVQAGISNIFHITGVPETYLIDASGRLAAINIGPFSSEDEIRVFLQQ